NAAIAVAAAEAFFGNSLAPEVVKHACASVTSPGRMEVVGRAPLVILAGAQALARGLIEELPVEGETVAVVGLLEGRDPSAMLHALIPAGVKVVFACTAPSPRAMTASTI